MSESLQEVVSSLEEDIVFGYLHPRERLVEDQLIERFAAKRHVIRDALLELERIGLVERKTNRGASVRDLTPNEVEQIYQVRHILESAAAAVMPLPASAEIIAQLSRIQAEHDAACEKAETRRVFRLNIEFHRALFAGCGNAYLASAIEEFGQKSHGIRSYSIANPNYLDKARAEHRAIIHALQAGDRDKLVRLFQEHIDAAKVAYLNAYAARFPERQPVGAGA